jgi:hypothetical protein
MRTEIKTKEYITLPRPTKTAIFLMPLDILFLVESGLSLSAVSAIDVIKRIIKNPIIEIVVYQRISLVKDSFIDT